MTLANAKVLHEHFLKLGKLAEAKQLEGRYPELEVKEAKKEEPKKEVKKDGKRPKR